MPRPPDLPTLRPKADPHAWPEERTRPGIPRTGIARQLPPPGSSEESDREVLLRAIADMRTEFEERLAISRRESEAPRRRTWEDQLTKVAAAVAVVVGSFAALKPTPKDERVDDAYKQLGEAVTKLDSHQRSTDSSLEGLRAWLAGYLASTGVKVAEPRGAPPAAVVELQPAPLVTSDTITPHQAPAVQVRTPLPLPPASSKPVVLKPLKD